MLIAVYDPGDGSLGDVVEILDYSKRPAFVNATPDEPVKAHVTRVRFCNNGLPTFVSTRNLRIVEAEDITKYSLCCRKTLRSMYS